MMSDTQFINKTNKKFDKFLFLFKPKFQSKEKKEVKQMQC